MILKKILNLMNNADFGEAMENVKKIEKQNLSQQIEEEAIWCQNPVSYYKVKIN